MAYFDDLNEDIMTIIDILLGNQNLCKYLYYPKESLPLSQPDITDTSVLLMQNIYPLPKNPNVIKDEMSLVNVYFSNSVPHTQGSIMKKSDLVFDVMCHLNIWMCGGGLRPYYMCSEIDKLFNNKYISSVSANKIYFNKLSIYQYSDLFYGYRLVYHISDNSNISDGM